MLLRRPLYMLLTGTRLLPSFGPLLVLLLSLYVYLLLQKMDVTTSTTPLPNLTLLILDGSLDGLFALDYFTPPMRLRRQE